ncbi:MAG: class I SAM-dependent methyltransferase [Kofleriaceae bacterium]|nr:class I SAM-dependent methyltransferase [Kofleriaceae bacterium]
MPPGDLSVTALYTSQVWAWGGLPGAELYATVDGKRVFDATNAALGAARLLQRGGAPLRHALLHRHAMIDHLLAASGQREVLELAAGLSRRGAAFTADPAMRYTEVDLPPVIARKRALLERSDAGRAVQARPGLRLVDADVETAALDAWVTPGAPVFVIAEGLMVYLDAAAQRRLWARVAALGDVTFVFDLVPWCEQPRPGRVGAVLEAAMKRFTGGRSFERDQRTRADLRAELLAAGFAAVDVHDSTEVASAWALPHPAQRTGQVVFACASQAAVNRALSA